MNRIDEIKQRILDTKVARQMLNLEEYDEIIDDLEYLLSLNERYTQALKRISDLHIRGAADSAADEHRRIAKVALEQ